MLVGKISLVTGKKNWMELDITMEQYVLWAFKGKSVVEVFPDLSLEEREFLLTGMSLKEMDDLYENDNTIYELES